MTFDGATVQCLLFVDIGRLARSVSFRFLRVLWRERPGIMSCIVVTPADMCQDFVAEISPDECVMALAGFISSLDSFVTTIECKSIEAIVTLPHGRAL